MKIEIRRSTRRKRTITAKLIDDRMVIQLPAAMPGSDQEYWVKVMKEKLEARHNERNSKEKTQLEELAASLNDTYLEGKALPRSIVYSPRQQSIFGSCSVRSRAIRISSRVRAFPPWVISYIVLHELAHLLQPDHSRQFWDMVKRYPLTDKALGFLMGYAYGRAARRKK